MPLFGLKLLAVIVDRNQAFITILVKLNLITILLDYFSIDHKKFNLHTVKIVKSIVSSKEVDLQELVDMKLVDKMNGILSRQIRENNAEWCTDNLLEMMTELLH